MNAVEKSALAWEYPGQDWCQNHCYQQTGPTEVDRCGQEWTGVDKQDRKENEERDFTLERELELNEQNINSFLTHLIVIIDFVSSSLSYNKRENRN